MSAMPFQPVLSADQLGRRPDDLVRPPRANETAESLQPRAGARTDAEVVRMTEDAAVKENAFPSRPGYPSGMANMRTHLHVVAWVKNTTYAKNVWVDVHVFDGGNIPFHKETLALGYARPAGDGGDVFSVDTHLYQGMVATPGSVDPRPDARVVLYRLYAELNGEVFTDGVEHRCELKPDSATA